MNEVLERLKHGHYVPRLGDVMHPKDLGGAMAQGVTDGGQRAGETLSNGPLQHLAQKSLARYPQASVTEMNFNPPSYCPPDGEMVAVIQKNVEALRGFKPQPIVSLGGTDARLWRYRDIPAYVYGPFPYGMGSADEHVGLEEFLHIVRVHVLSAYDYLMAG